LKGDTAMSVSTATQYASYFTDIVTGMIEIDFKAKGLATEFHETVQKVMTEAFEGREFVGKEASSLYVDVCMEVERAMKADVVEKFGLGSTLTESVPTWKNYKSIYKSGLEMGLNPMLYLTFSKFKTGKLEEGARLKQAKGSATDTKAATGGDTSNAGGESSNVSTLTVAEHKLSVKVKTRLDLAVEELYKLAEADEEAALRVVADFEGALRSNLRKLPRFAALAQG
jgi:hypothetical protein